MGVKVTKKHTKLYICILLCVLLTVGVSLEAFILFRSFSDTLHVSSYDLQLRLIDHIYDDKNLPLWLIRLFHNKFVGILFDTFDTYLRFWNASFLSLMIGIVGVVGVWIQMYYFFFRARNTWLWFAFAAVLLCPFIEMFSLLNLPFPVRSVLLSLPFLVWALLGYWNFVSVDSRFRMYFVMFLIFISLWSTVVLNLYYVNF